MMLTPQHASVVRHQRLFGVTNEELRLIIEPMARTGAEAIGSMGSDTPIAVLSQRPRLLYDYFTQLFAQVTNPPLDAIREELVTSLEATVGPERNLLQPEPASCRQICLPFPVIDNDDLAKLLYVNEHGETPGFRGFAVDGLFPVSEGGPGLEAALDKVCQQVSEAIAFGANIIVLSDRNASPKSAPIPSCSSQPRCTTISCARRNGPGWGWSSRAGREGGAPFCLADRLRGGGGEPLPRPRVGRRDGARRPTRGGFRTRGLPPVPESREQGCLEGDVEDGHLDGRLLHGAQVFEAIGLDAISWTGTSGRRRAGWAASASPSWPRR